MMCGLRLNRAGSGAAMSSHSEYERHLSASMIDLANNFPLGEGNLEATLASVTSAAVELIRGVDHADVLLVNTGRFESVAPTAPLVKEIDAIQERLREGPCLQAATADSVIRCTDLRDEIRWPRFAAAATKLGVYSMLSFQLYTRRGGAGALNLLGGAPRAFTPEAEAVGAMLATHAALALAAANTQEQFHSALASRDHIGQAKGIIMERFNVDAVRAFEMLKKLSQETNTPLRELAERVINSRNP
jgi:transcriptional regulator with GAF, ATPase, and Fis domain